ncbi:MAG: prealbumin-like fold domain-containing protein, partial [Methanosphaera sp.]|nr:prealbumin-like fold domain-containing protein [Methanosphaera sp.]
KNEDGTVTYRQAESEVGDNTTINKSVIVGYPSQYSNCTIGSTVDLYGIYKDEVAGEGEQLIPEKLATGEGEIELKNINDQWTYFHETISTDKTMTPDRIYSEDLDKDINFKTKIKSTTHISSSNPSEYGIAITDDFLQVYTDECKRLKDSEYEFTSVTLPGRNTFHNANGYEISDGDYTVKVKILKRDREDTSNRTVAAYETVYDGKWTNASLTLTNELKDSVAVRVEVYGLKESINEFYINVEGKININESIESNEYINPTYIRNCNMTDMLNMQGDSIINDTVTEISYADQSIYEEDMRIYGKGLLRSSDTIVIMEKQELPGYYSAKAEMENFSVDKEIENFLAKQKHSIEVANTQAREISKIKIYGVNEKEELETLIETLKFTYKDLSFKYYLSEDITNDDEKMQDYIRERAKIEKNGKEILITFNFEDNPIVSKSFSIGYEVDANLTYENYYKEVTPTYKVTTYGVLEETDLEQKVTTTYAGKTMVYNQTSKNILLALASHQQLIKLVKSEYTNGEFVEQGAAIPLNSEYTYRLKLRNGYNTLIKTEIIDILEHSELTKVNEGYPYSESEWYGKLKSVDTKYLESKGGTVKVYYASTTEPDENSWTLMESHTDGIWETANAEQTKAIKIEVDGEIEENSVVHVDVNMQSPTDETLVDKHTYNTYKINAEAIDLYSGLRASVLNEMPSNNTEARLIEKEYNLVISKVDAENNSKLSGVRFGIYDTQGEKVRTNITGILGDTIVKNLKEGTYIIKEEVAPLGYEKPEDYTLVIENGNYTLTQNGTVIAEGTAEKENDIPSIKITIQNEREKGSIEVYKIDEYLSTEKQEIPLQGIDFELQDTEGNIL